jgi:hypothetical protein
MKMQTYTKPGCTNNALQMATGSILSDPAAILRISRCIASAARLGTIQKSYQNSAKHRDGEKYRKHLCRTEPPS